jgi:hypothetical protein
MQDTTIQTSEHSSSPDRASKRGLYRRVQSLRYAVTDSLFHFRLRWRTTMRIWHGALRSFLGHIRSLSPKELLVPLCGPSMVEHHIEGLIPNLRTIARVEYTKMLLDRLPWADTADLRIFLMGFDAGECFASRKVDSEAKTPVEIASWSTYFHHQASSAASGQISEASPAAIAGVTRKLECTRQKL